MLRPAVTTCPFAAVLLVAAVDLVVRSEASMVWSAKQWMLYFGTIVYQILFLFILGQFIARWREKWTVRYSILIVVLGGASSSFYVGQYYYYAYFGAFPNPVSFQFIIQEPRESIENYFARMRRFFDDNAGGNARARTPERRARAERLANMSYEEILETQVIFVTPESVTDKLARFSETLGLSGFTAELNPGGLLPPEAVSRSLKLLTDEVMPAFK